MGESGVYNGENKTVQEYIDEVPAWRDGTSSPATPLTVMQWRIWLLASAGKFFEGMMVFITGIALPLMVREFGLTAAEKGAIGAAPLFGILIGASFLGSLSDRFGRKRMFIVEMLIFTVSLICTALSPGYSCILFFLFIMGIALGCDYPTAHMIISESIPSRSRGKLVLSAFGFQAVGAMAGTLAGYMILYETPDLSAWRWMYAAPIIPAVLITVARLFIPDSSQWLVARGRIAKAESELLSLLKRTPQYPKEVSIRIPETDRKSDKSYFDLFRKKNARATMLASMPWFLQDLSTYGIGIFTPTILATVIGGKIEHAKSVSDIVLNDMLSAKGAALVDILLLIGIIAAVFLADKVGRIKLQVLGFCGCAAGLFMASLSFGFEGHARMFFIFSGFMLFNFMTNMGPNAMTYLISGEVFPTAVRGKGAGFAALFGKIGAVLTAFLFPVLLKDIGTQILLHILAGTSLLGAFITWKYRMETAGVNLEEIG